MNRQATALPCDKRFHDMSEVNKLSAEAHVRRTFHHSCLFSLKKTPLVTTAARHSPTDQASLYDLPAVHRGEVQALCKHTTYNGFAHIRNGRGLTLRAPFSAQPVVPGGGEWCCYRQVSTREGHVLGGGSTQPSCFSPLQANLADVQLHSTRGGRTTTTTQAR